MTETIHTITADDIGFHTPMAAFDTSIRPAEVKQQELNEHTQSLNGTYERWGDSGCLPTDWRRKIEDTEMLASSMADKAAMIYGKGITYYKDVYVDGEKKREYFQDAQVDDFIEETMMDLTMQERIMDFLYYGNCVGEFILSRDKRSINRFLNLKTEYSRLGVQDEKGLRHKVGYSAKFSNGQTPSDNENIDIRLLTAFNYRKELKSNHKKYALWSQFISPGRLDYGRPPWAALLKKDGWADVSSNAPVLTNQLMQKQFKIRYIVRIHVKMWDFWYKDWNGYSAEDQAAKVKEKKSEIIKALEGKSADLMSIRSIISTTYSHPSGKEFNGITVEAVDDKIKKDEWLPNSDAANLHIVQTLGVGTSGKGVASGSNTMAGSGSDKRVERINAVALNPFLETQLLMPLRIMAFKNGWTKGIKFSFDHMLPTTLDRSPTGTTSPQNLAE